MPQAEGLARSAEQHFLVAESAQDVAATVLRIVENPQERMRLSTAGRERMLSNHAWPRSMQRLDGIISRCLAVRTTQHAKPLESNA